MTLLSLTNLALHQGDYERAENLIEENRALLDDIEDRNKAWYLHFLLGEIARARHEYDRAHLHHIEGLRTVLKTSNKHSMCRSLEVIACIEATWGRTQRAIHVWGAAGALRESIGIPPSMMERAHYEPRMTATRAEMDPELWSKLWGEGRSMPLEQAVEYALAGPRCGASARMS